VYSLLFSPHIVPQCSKGKNAAEAANDAGHLDLAKTLREAAEAQTKVADEAKAAATAKAVAALTKATAETKAASVPEKKLTQAQLAAAVAAVSKTRGKPILRSRISFVGEGAAGKTSVVRAICSEADGDPKSTIGIDRSCVEFDISAVNVEAVGGEVCCSRCAQLISALFVACALKAPAVEHESVCRHSIQ
jgi:hypothetical protein